MADQFSIDITGHREIARLLKQLGDKGPPALKAEMHAEVTNVMADSREQVPVDLGNLRASGFVDDKSLGASIEFVAGYGGPAAPYALRVHENPRSGKTGGFSPQGKKYGPRFDRATGTVRHFAKVGKWHYLSDPFNAAVNGMTDRIAAGLRSRLPEVS